MPWTADSSSLEQQIPADMRGELRDGTTLRNDGDALRTRLAEDGYVLIRGAFDREDVLAAREEVFSRLVDVGEVREPAVDGIATGTSRREELQPDLGAFWKSVCEGPKLRKVTHAGPMLDLMATVHGKRR